ncbi:peptidylprolyl isomerase [Thiomicrorhabdus immobilis]|uniref:Peptidylprolyl isomerase n=1 Tax=Thiomicrorhabdus immobilis TaxID=2791037 RepID=A0ABM7MDT6_9GAMM|nr:peptidylprolyl isomerase [Thiomicrorhabdus immobilis]BCN93560.1 peptidylprolyl isomerase [Thiomicrorhabdus immobilis]
MIHPDSRAKAHHILVADEAECLALKSQIHSLEELIELAKTHSICPSAKIGGDIGLVKPEVIVAEMAEAIFNEPIETLLGPIKTVHGYHLTWVTKRHLANQEQN